MSAGVVVSNSSVVIVSMVLGLIYDTDSISDASQG